jgi:hypothetical protein
VDLELKRPAKKFVKVSLVRPKGRCLLNFLNNTACRAGSSSIGEVSPACPARGVVSHCSLEIDIKRGLGVDGQKTQ